MNVGLPVAVVWPQLYFKHMNTVASSSEFLHVRTKMIRLYQGIIQLSAKFTESQTLGIQTTMGMLVDLLSCV